MKTYTYIKVQQKEIISMTCNKCGKTTNMKDANSILDFQEWLSINFTGGYGSIFGDGSEYECDLCQQCTNELLGNYLRKL